MTIHHDFIAYFILSKRIDLFDFRNSIEKSTVLSLLLKHPRKTSPGSRSYYGLRSRSVSGDVAKCDAKGDSGFDLLDASLALQV